MLRALLQALVLAQSGQVLLEAGKEPGHFRAVPGYAHQVFVQGLVGMTVLGVG